ncbi:zinc-finger-containing protein [Azonexus hydrophilus]|uniref:zinc-finger-containing protein n=1 Tax=Azonexus hydrophilus TaxID=418702 RepID=UPI003C711937
MEHLFPLYSAMPPDMIRVINSCKSVMPAMVNLPHTLSRITDKAVPVEICPFCEGRVALVNNACFYGGREYGWPLAYACDDCGARVGCHPGSTVPLGTLADKQTQAARKMAHDAFDPIWKASALPGARRRAYAALAKAMGGVAHISSMNVTQCTKVVAICARGGLTL